jgi:exodeoxyribonuclease-5
VIATTSLHWWERPDRHVGICNAPGVYADPGHQASEVIVKGASLMDTLPIDSIAHSPMLTDEQQAVMADIDDFMADPHRQMFTLFGLAGTGKTTLLAHVAHQHRHDALCCPTGKAASVLRDKTGLQTGTVHSYFYKLLKAETSEDGRKLLTFVPRHARNELFRDVVLLDECSMVPHSIGAQLMHTGAKVLAVGDPGQLPPVKEPAFFTEPNALLRIIHRQALESPIIRQAIAVRHGKGYRADGPDFQVVPRATEALLAEVDVVLCQKNTTRSRLNQLCRRIAGRTAPWPEAGEPLLCLKNAPRYGVWNGGIYPAAAGFRPDDANISVVVDGDIITIPNVLFAGQKPRFASIEATTTEFDFGYCLTVHKAQGSEWPRVLLIDEYSAKQHRREWLYTGLTRAARSIVVIRA